MSEQIDSRKIARYGAWYVAEYRLLNMRKWFGAIVAFGLGNPILFLGSVGIGVGALVNQGTGGNGVDGVPYLTFLAPALLASAAIQSAMDEVTFPTLHGFVWQKIFFGIGATSVTGRQIADGVFIAAQIRNVFTVFLYWSILCLVGALDAAQSWLAMPAAIFAGVSFSALMLAISAYLQNDEGVFAIIGRFVIAPMFMFSGTFYPLTILPVYLQWVGWISPLWHATEIGRYLSYDHPISLGMLLVHFGYLLVLFIVGFHLARNRYQWRVTQ